MRKCRAALAGRIPALAVGVYETDLLLIRRFPSPVGDVLLAYRGVDPVEFLRTHLDSIGALPAHALANVPDGTRVTVGGVVTHRQRPATAGGITFLNLKTKQA